MRGRHPSRDKASRQAAADRCYRGAALQSGCSHQTGMPSLGSAPVRYNCVAFWSSNVNRLAGLPVAIDGESELAEVGPTLLSCNRSWTRAGVSSRVGNRSDPGLRSYPEVLSDACPCQLRLARRRTVNHMRSVRAGREPIGENVLFLDN